MSFVNKLSELNEYGTLITENVTENSYSYSDFMSDMLNIETALNEAVNSYLRIVNESVINILLETSDNSTALVAVNKVKESEKSSLYEKIKKWWREIVDKFFQWCDSAIDYIYKQLVLHQKYIKNHKDEIMRTTVIYKKANASVEGTGVKVEVYIDKSEITTYENILYPKINGPILDVKELKDKYYKNSNADEIFNASCIDKEGLYKYYKSALLGDKSEVSLDEFNKEGNKLKLIESIDNQYAEVSKRKSRIRNLKRDLYDLDSKKNKELNQDSIKELQLETTLQIESMRMYNKVVIEYCKEVVRLLKIFIKSSEKKEDE